MGLAEIRASEDETKSKLERVRERLASASAIAREVSQIEGDLAAAKSRVRSVESPYRDSLRETISTLEQRLDAAKVARGERAQLRVEEANLLFSLEGVREGFARAGVHHSLPILDVVIATPCPARWEEMEGDGDMRFCKSCEKNVFNLSMMSHEEAQATIFSAQKNGGACMRMYRRMDGTMLTQDCPVGVRKRQFWRRTTGVAAAGLIVAALGAIEYDVLIKQTMRVDVASAGATSDF